MIQLFKEHLNVKLRCVFQTSKVKDYFSLKCKTPEYLLSKVTYRYTCRGDPDKVYIGETNRHVLTRASEHLDLKAVKPTSVAEHIQSCDTCQNELFSGNLDWKCLEIIDKCRTKLECEVREAFLIRKHKPLLDTQLHQRGLTLKMFN